MTLVAVEIPRLEIKVEELANGFGKFSIGPLEPGYGMTLGNPLRRALLSSIPGTAVTWVKIEGITHEYTIVPHVKEDVPTLLLNFKAIRLRSLAERPTTGPSRASPRTRTSTATASTTSATAASWSAPTPTGSTMARTTGRSPTKNIKTSRMPTSSGSST